MKQQSYWLDIEYTPRPFLEKDIHTDVVVVGGGITGVSIAYHAVCAGLSTVLIEKNTIASGSAGKNGGMVVEGLHIDLVEAVNNLGEEQARNLWQTTIDSREYVTSLIKKNNISCDFSQVGSFYFSKGIDDINLIHNELKQRKTFGFSGNLLQQFNTHKEGIFAPDDCTLHPVKFIRGLADIAKKKGLLVFENTPALSFSRDKVVTQNGTVYAKKVVLAMETNIPEIEITNAEIKRELGMVTEPLPLEVFDKMDWNKAAMFWSTGYDYVPVRKIGNRLFFNDSVVLNPSEQNLEEVQNKIIKSFFKIFPSISDISIKVSHRWTGLLLYPNDNKPTIREIEGHYEVFGCGGNGLTNGIILGKTLIDYFFGKPIPDIYRDK